MKKVEGIKADINRLSALLWAEEKRITDENAVILHEEVANLMSGVDVTAGDYYAPTRYYSRIPGVKNIRIRELYTADSQDNEKEKFIIVKVTSPRGELLLSEIHGMKISIIHSMKYKEGLDY